MQCWRVDVGGSGSSSSNWYWFSSGTDCGLRGSGCCRLRRRLGRGRSACTAGAGFKRRCTCISTRWFTQVCSLVSNAVPKDLLSNASGLHPATTQTSLINHFEITTTQICQTYKLTTSNLKKVLNRQPD